MQPAASAAQPVPPRNAAVIGESMYVQGEIHSVEDLFIAGEVDGSLESQHSLIVGPKGKVKANIKAQDVTIHGSVHGSVEVSGKIIIHQNGSLIGDIKTAGIVIDDGAYFKGSIDIVRPAPAPARETAAAKPAASPQAVA
jgi:cytoskeletal protein CcmA (bactofilin family)